MLKSSRYIWRPVAEKTQDKDLQVLSDTVLDWPVIFLRHHLGVCNEMFSFSHTCRVWVCRDVFVFYTIQVYRPCKNLHT